ncbi:hypothetical protein DOY81_000415 [Sarcophaga bullata]|nr:hypothetical protein DOY81_000415 [Sarcophaga bullata]
MFLFLTEGNHDRDTNNDVDDDGSSAGGAGGGGGGYGCDCDCDFFKDPTSQILGIQHGRCIKTFWNNWLSAKMVSNLEFFLSELHIFRENYIILHRLSHGHKETMLSWHGIRNLATNSIINTSFKGV